MANLALDLTGARDDVFVAQLDVGEQRRRVREAAWDLAAAQTASRDEVCRAVAVLTRDDHAARNGVIAVNNDTGRAVNSVAYVVGDLAGLGRLAHEVRVAPEDRRRLLDALARGRLELKRIRAVLNDSAAVVEQLRARVHEVARQAERLCGALAPDKNPR